MTVQGNMSERARLDRISVNSAILVAGFLGVLLLSSQSAASYPTYALCLVMLLRFVDWNDVFRCRLVWPILLVLVYLPLTGFWSLDGDARELMSTWLRALLIFTFVVCFAECQLRGALQRWLYHTFAITGAAVAALCIVIFYLTDPEDGRLNGLGQLDTPVVAAVVFGFAALTAMHLLLSGGAGSPWTYRLCLLVSSASVLLTGSRAVIISLLLGAVALLLAHRVRSPGRYLLLLGSGAALLLALLLLALLDPDLERWLLPRGDSYRLVIWRETLERLAAQPVFGLGILTADNVTLPPYEFHHPHSLYLSVAFQAGAVGLLLFIFLLVRVVRELLRYYEHSDAKFALGLLGLALPAYTLDGHELIDKISDVWFLIWLPVAIALGLRWHGTAYRSP